MSKLLTKELLSNIPDLYQTENQKDPICYVKLFTPDSNWTWYIIEISKDDETTCFGYVIGHENELGYFNLQELENLRGGLGLPVERDFSFKSIELSKVRQGIY